ncbi:hypothetical protein Sango_1305900 [Sesamum angolense]|uniref:Uncharacterized protein n=1 Tax=Sesamum angolense TaxID=2727404 RepID=A0AAE1WRP3_9LAMI|nr:hypothetical protein Sango_1305900 [Sesamum angolense]
MQGDVAPHSEQATAKSPRLFWATSGGHGSAAQVDELMRAEEVEIYYDPAELFAPLLKAPLISGPNTEQQQEETAASTSPKKCPFIN